MTDSQNREGLMVRCECGALTHNPRGVCQHCLGNRATPDDAVLSDALLPCPNPWCSSRSKPMPVRSRMASNGWHVACACGVRSWAKSSEIKAVAVWNARATPPASDAVASGAGFVLVPVEQVREWYTGAWAYWLETIKDHDGDNGSPTPQHLLEMESMLAAAPKVASDAGADQRPGEWDHRYRPLKHGEIIVASDECRRDDGTWATGICVGQPAPDPAYTSHRVYRRLIVASEAAGLREDEDELAMQISDARHAIAEYQKAIEAAQPGDHALMVMSSRCETMVARLQKITYLAAALTHPAPSGAGEVARDGAGS